MVEWFGHPSASAVLDGELIYAGTDGRPRFYKLLYEMRTRWPDQDRMIYFVFDLLHEDGADLRSLTLTERKTRLNRLCRRSKISIMKPVLTFPDGTILIEHCARLGFEGVVAKKVDRPYVSGPSKAWAKTKCSGWKRDNQGRFKLFQGR